MLFPACCIQFDYKCVPCWSFKSWIVLQTFFFINFSLCLSIALLFMTNKNSPLFSNIPNRTCYLCYTCQRGNRTFYTLSLMKCERKFARIAGFLPEFLKPFELLVASYSFKDCPDIVILTLLYLEIFLQYIC